MNIQLLEQGLLLMVIGMGFVFFFLSIMIICMNINSKIMKVLNKYFPEATEEEPRTKKKKTDNDAEIALAIACAFAAANNAKI